MKKILLCLASLVIMFSCSKEDNENRFENDKKVKTYTPAVGYESPYDLNNIDPFFPIKFINNTSHQINYRLVTMAAFFDGNWDGIIDYTSYGGPLMTPTNAPSLLSNNEFNIQQFGQSLSSPPYSVVSTDIYSLNYDYIGGPYTPNEIDFLRKFSKLAFAAPLINGLEGKILKHDVPKPFSNMNSLPPVMSAEKYKIISGAPAYNPVLNQYMGISVFHDVSREIIWPNMPDFQSEYFFIGPGGASLHLYFKTYIDHIEIVLE